jgi:glucose-1-phosphate thymidylyltransferase
MKVIILLGGYGTRMRPHAWSRPKPLLRVANNTVVGHILDRMHELTAEEVIFVVGYKGEQIRAWIEDHYPDLDLHFVTQAEAMGQAHALWLCREFLQQRGDGGEVIVTLGDIIIDADFGGGNGFIRQIIEKPATGAYTQALAGVYWFRDGRALWQLLDQTLASGRQTKGEYYLVDTFQLMLERGMRIAIQPIRSIVDVGSPENRLQANQRLLEAEGANRSSSGEPGRYTVIPPVYIHPTATIDASVVGPYVTIGRNTRLDHVIIQNSIIDDHTTIYHTVLADSVVGERVYLSGRPLSAVVGDDSKLIGR